MRVTVLSVLAAIGLVGLALGMTVLDHMVEGSGSELSDFLLDFADRLLVIGVAVGASLLFLRLSNLRRRTESLELDLNKAAREGRSWRAQSRRFLDGLSQSVEKQFCEWDLTPAEADVAGMLLKGATLREIATLRRTSEATIRQQAGNVYRKSGLASRAELSAYFLEDLFSFGEATLTPDPSPDIRYDA